ncbi:unnamed protein product [Pedinophyceae sp. YPF-701]|nr:unnamed protein product [Pedinophyceae sp. YPF-701]
MLESLRRGLRGSQALSGLQRAFATRTSMTDFATTSGAPSDVYTRKAVIYTPAKSAGQSALGNTHEGVRATWRLDFDTQVAWENPLMGWTSTADPLEGVRTENGLAFYTKEQAVRFCEKYGFAYEIKDPRPRSHVRSRRFWGYGDNFSVKRKGIPEGGLRENLPKGGGAATKK